MTHRRRRPAISVEVPARQRRVLDAFFAGHLPAGQLDRALAVGRRDGHRRGRGGARAPALPHAAAPAAHRRLAAGTRPAACRPGRPIAWSRPCSLPTARRSRPSPSASASRSTTWRSPRSGAIATRSSTTPPSTTTSCTARSSTSRASTCACSSTTSSAASSCAPSSSTPPARAPPAACTRASRWTRCSRRSGCWARRSGRRRSPARRDDDPDELHAAVQAAGQVMRHVTLVSTAVAQAYLDEAEGVWRDREVLSRDVLEAVVGGRGDTDATRRRARALGVTLHDDYAVVVATPRGDPHRARGPAPRAGHRPHPPADARRRRAGRPARGRADRAVPRRRRDRAGRRQGGRRRPGDRADRRGDRGRRQRLAPRRRRRRRRLRRGARGRGDRRAAPASAGAPCASTRCSSSTCCARAPTPTACSPTRSGRCAPTTTSAAASSSRPCASTSRRATTSRAAPSALCVHPNTVVYRLRRIKDLTGRDPNDPDDLLLLTLGIKLAASDRPG